jgi:translocation and assembly module TamA
MKHNLKIVMFTLIMCAPNSYAQQENQNVAPLALATTQSDQLISTQPTQFRIGQAKGAWLDLIKEHIPLFSSSSEPQALTPSLMRKIQKDISSILATEGYFSPVIQLDKKNPISNIVEVNIDAGLRTIVKEININIIGNLNNEVNAGNVDAINSKSELMKRWVAFKGKPFRDDDWNKEKNVLMESLTSHSYAGASLIDSRATIDVESASATLDVDIDSGPVYHFGELQVKGLERYPLWLIDRFQPPKKGELYSKERLFQFQNALQNSAYFSSVLFNVEPDASNADALPIDIQLVEKQTRDISLSTGYSSETGFRGEVSYRDRNALSQVWDLRSAVRLEQKRQLAYADIYLPPTNKNKLDSFGALIDRLDAAGLVQTRTALGVKRVTTLGLLEQRLGANYTQEDVSERAPSVGQKSYLKRSRALVGTIGWTWREVDDIISPRQGHRAQLDFAFSDKAIISDQRFLSVYGKYQYWHPISLHDSLLLRAEFGQIFSSSSSGIPENFLFRTGGGTTVRGYAYQTLGPKQGSAVVGGRVLGTSSIEYIRWLASGTGIALFLDTGDAANTWREFSPKQGVGIGLRLPTPAGPIAFDVSYGRQVKKVRLDFSIAIAF